jgi:hypothetical protein
MTLLTVGTHNLPLPLDRWTSERSNDQWSREESNVFQHWLMFWCSDVLKESNAISSL